jgi:hypothetical protein
MLPVLMKGVIIGQIWELDLPNVFGRQSCVQLYSLAETSQLAPAFGLIYEGRYWSAKIDDISLQPSGAHI